MASILDKILNNKIVDTFKKLFKSNDKTVFTKILDQGRKQNILPTLEKQAMEWFKQQALNTNIDPNKVLNGDKSRIVSANDLKIGEMYFYCYDAKHKDTLPYWDRFPLVIPFDSKRVGSFPARNMSGRGFMAMNLHYLPPQFRAVLLDALLNISRVHSLDENAKIMASYQMMKSASSNLKYFKPCVKQYLLSHVVGGKFYRIAPAEWPIAVFLPIDRFQKADRHTVWADSLRKVK